MRNVKECSEHEFKKYRTILSHFTIPKGQIVRIKVLKNGRINNTAVVEYMTEEGVKEYTLQKINVTVFQRPIELMENVSKVTKHIQNKGKTALKVNTVKESLVSEYLYFDEKTESYWRLYDYIDADVKNSVAIPGDMKLLGEAIGDFSKALSDFDAEKLVETIPGFHDTKKRYEKFLSTIESDMNAIGEARSSLCKEEVDFILARGLKAGIIVDAIKKGEIPLRVSHNDTKLNNVLFDKESKLPMCLIDLDTVMPGTVLYDFGDAARYGCNTESEEATSTENVSFNLEYFSNLAKGFLESMVSEITKKEVDLLVDAVWMITFEQSIRFLDDHIAGNHYFTVEYDGKNLERARVQIALLKDIENKREEMKNIVSSTWTALYK